MVDKVIHPSVDLIRHRVIERIEQARAAGETYESIAEKCGSVKNHIFDLHKKHKGVTLNMALKIWEGLGGNPVELFEGLTHDPFWERLGHMTKEQREIILKLIDLLDQQGQTTGVKTLIEHIKSLHSEVFPEETNSQRPH